MVQTILRGSAAHEQLLMHAEGRVELNSRLAQPRLSKAIEIGVYPLSPLTSVLGEVLRRGLIMRISRNVSKARQAEALPQQALAPRKSN
jgi:hypothetical protein